MSPFWCGLVQIWYNLNAAILSSVQSLLSSIGLGVDLTFVLTLFSSFADGIGCH
ncbi:MAG: hypothetical protein U1A27_07875 [Phycisphaerae bacterium]